VQTAVFLAFAVIFGAHFEGGIPGIALAFLLTAMTAGALAALAASIALRTGSLSLLQNLFPIVFVLLFTAPAFFPRDLLDPTLEAIAQVNPLTYIVEAIRAGLHGSSDLGDPLAGFLSAAALLASATALAVWAMRARMRAT
jgi:ABC-2 type transport system permease protein